MEEKQLQATKKIVEAYFSKKNKELDDSFNKQISILDKENTRTIALQEMQELFKKEAFAILLKYYTEEELDKKGIVDTFININFVDKSGSFIGLPYSKEYSEKLQELLKKDNLEQEELKEEERNVLLMIEMCETYEQAYQVLLNYRIIEPSGKVA